MSKQFKVTSFDWIRGMNRFVRVFLCSLILVSSTSFIVACDGRTDGEKAYDTLKEMEDAAADDNE